NGFIIDSPVVQWKNESFVENMKQYFDSSIFINNDVNCAAMGERWFGVTEKIDDFVYITIGDGVGCAIVSDGNLITGKNYMAGEIGYFAVESDEPNAYNTLGEFGAFENKVSMGALLKQEKSIRELFTEYKNLSDNESFIIIKNFIKTLSIGIANIVSLLNPEKVVLGGTLSSYMTPLLDDLKKMVSSYTPISTEMEISDLGDDSELLGIVSFVFSEVRSIII